MMQEHMQQRFDQLLGFIKTPELRSLVRENVAAAREMLDTLLTCGLLLPEEYRSYHAQIGSAKLVAGAEDLRRDTDKARDMRANEDGVRVAASEDGAYRYNPIAGGFE